MKPRPFAWPMGLILLAVAFLSFCPSKAHPQVAPYIAGMSTEEDVVKHMAALYAHFWPQIRRGITAGLPQWYKDELAQSAFAERA